MSDAPKISEVPPLSQVVMNWHRHSQPFTILNTVLHEYDADQFVDFVRARRFDFEAHVLAHRIAEATQSTTVTVAMDFPATPWQFFKQRHAHSWWLGWLVRRRPVRTQRFVKPKQVTLTIDRFHEFPEAKFAFPEQDFGKPYLVDRVHWNTATE